MTVSISVSGILKSYTNNNNIVEVSSGISVRKALSLLGIPPDIVALVIINDIPASKDDLLSDGDRVQLFAVVGGG